MKNFKQELEKNQDLVQLKESARYPGLFVLKYRKKVFYDNLWNDFLEETRGLVIDKDHNIIARPFRKIYNFGIEEKAPKISLNEKVTAFRKINGFMIAASLYQDQIILSTTGSLDSDFVGYAEKYFKDNKAIQEAIHFNGPKYTWMFEVCHPEDPHIIEEKEGLYLLGMRNIKSGNLEVDWMHDISDAEYKRMTGNVVERKKVLLGDLMEELKTVQHEGFVFYTKDGRAAKTKSKHYLVKKLFMRGNIEKLFDRNIKKTIDEEYYPLVDWINERREEFSALTEEDRRLAIEGFLKC